MALWFGISIPLVFIGSLVGFKRRAIQNPVGYNIVPSLIKKQPWYLENTMACAIGGLLPFGAFFIELQFIIKSIWMHYFYYLFGFVLLDLLVVIIMSAEVSVLYTYVMLCQ